MNTITPGYTKNRTDPRFLEIDPVEGGCRSDYSYVYDSINQTDLSGLRECRRYAPYPRTWVKTLDTKVPMRGGFTYRTSWNGGIRIRYHALGAGGAVSISDNGKAVRLNTGPFAGVEHVFGGWIADFSGRGRYIKFNYYSDADFDRWWARIEVWEHHTNYMGPRQCLEWEPERRRPK